MDYGDPIISVLVYWFHFRRCIIRKLPDLVSAGLEIGTWIPMCSKGEHGGYLP